MDYDSTTRQPVRRVSEAHLPAQQTANAIVVGSGLPHNRDAGMSNLLEVLWVRRWTVIACCVVSLITALVYLARATPIFQSSAQIFLDQDRPQVIGSLYGNADIFNDGLFAQTRLITSTRLLAEVYKQPEIRQLELLSGSPNPVARLKQSLQVKASGKGEIIEIAMESPYADEAPVVVNGVVRAYMDYQNARRRSTAAEFLKILQAEKIKLRTELDQRWEQLLQYQRDHGILTNDSDRSNVVIVRLAQLSDALTGAQLATLEAKITHEEAQTARNDPAALQRLMLDDPDYRTSGQTGPDPTLAEIARLSQAIQYHAKYYGDNHRATMQYRRQLDAIAPNFVAVDHQVEARYLSHLQSKWRRADQRESQLRQAYMEQQELALSTNSQTVEYSQIQSSIRRIESRLDLIDNKIKELNVDEDYDVISVTILEPAGPGIQVKPQKARTVSLALIMGMMIGIGGALLQEFMDDRLRSAEEIGGILNLPVLGIIPSIEGKARVVASLGLEAETNRHSSTAEAYRTVRTAIHFGAAERKSKILLVTSPAAGDGKSTVSANLAIVFAQAGKRVLLIDADCRKPTQHRVFDVARETGLSTTILGHTTLEQAAVATSVENLSLLPCGPVPTNPSELLVSDAFTELLDTAAQQYDQIIIDSPPVMPVTDARIISAVAGSTVLVLRAERSGRRVAQHAAESLRSVGAHLIGAVVNAVPLNKSGYGYGYYNYYGYGRYGHDHNDQNSSNGQNGNGRKRLAELAKVRRVEAEESTLDV